MADPIAADHPTPESLGMTWAGDCTFARFPRRNGEGADFAIVGVPFDIARHQPAGLAIRATGHPRAVDVVGRVRRRAVAVAERAAGRP